MIIKLNESTNTSIKEVYYAVYADNADLTFIIKHTFEAVDNGWIDVSEECVGWHYGAPNSEDESTDFIGDMKKTYGERIDNDFLNDFISDLTKDGILLKVDDSGNTVSEKHFKSRKTPVNEDSEIPTKVRMPRIQFKPIKDDGIEDAREEVKWLLGRIAEDPKYVLYQIDRPAKSDLEKLIQQDPSVLTKICKKFKVFTNDFLNNYTFDKNRAVNRLMSGIINDASRRVNVKADIIDNSERSVARITREALDTYVKQTDVDTAYDNLYRCYHHWPLITIEEFTYVSPKEINRPEYSKVISSSFSTYYYYKTVVDINGEKVEFIYTISDYYSGGWN